MTRISLVAAIFLILSACDPVKYLEEVTSHGFGEQLLIPLNIETTSEIDTLAKDRVRVSEIRIKVPTKGTELWRGEINESVYRNYRGTRTLIREKTYTPTYVLAQDLNVSIRNALDYVYEIDTESDVILTVDTSLKIQNIHKETSLCREFETRVKITLMLLYSWPDEMKIRKKYTGKETTENCLKWTETPTAKSVARTLQVALTKAFQELIKSRE